MINDPPGEPIPKPAVRRAPDRRLRTFYSLFIGSLTPRRRAPRRRDERHIAMVDWHDAQWLAVAILILLLSVADAFLTLSLLPLGANEANPLLEPLLAGETWIFAATKVGLTACCVVLLTIVARLRLFGRFPVSFVLYAILAGYCALIGYELWLLEHLGGEWEVVQGGSALPAQLSGARHAFISSSAPIIYT